ncbi:MAG TPA: GNAT family N-acetyltransferase [Aestuariivirga sp.]|nr:GNAT family N-acetyltransferase [Aestuariivirga sp.]
MKLRTVESVADIPADQWNACANPAGFNPFVSHEFFKALEDSGSAADRTGWKAEHLVHETAKGEVGGIAPCYVKSHSQGEYVFDHGWAEAYHRAGGRYYPKLQTSVPFTPVTGPRLFSANAETRALLAKGLVSVCKELKTSSAHITFLPEADWAAADKAHWLQRQDIQFHWQNQGYTSFDNFLASLSSSKRKNIRKERKAVLEAGISFDWVTGKDLRESHWDAFFDFYMETGSRKWGSPYLTRKFFSLISKSMGPHVLLILARREGRIIAGALNFIGSEALYGRNWGASEHHDFLHFETCYYQAIDFAIQHKLARVEAGAQGQHKLARGYLPVKTYSLHHFAHPGLARAVGEYLEQERRAIDQDQALLAEHSPFRHETDD